MLYFAIDAVDAAGAGFSVLLRMTTLPHEGKDDPIWVTNTGKFRFERGKAVIIASPPEKRGDVVCIAKDVTGKLWTVIEFDQMIYSHFTQAKDGSYQTLALKSSGSGRTSNLTVGTVKAGGFTWTMSPVMVPSSTLNSP
jgi:hypothetical protein